MHRASIFAALLTVAATLVLSGVSGLALSGCTHDYDVFKPRGDAGPDGARASTLTATGQTDEPDTNEPESE